MITVYMSEYLINLKILLSFWDIIRRRDFTLGKTVRELEGKLASYCGAKYAIGVGNATDALILSLKACGIGPGDEVITSAVGFFSTAGAITWVNAKPVFVDANLETSNIDVSKIEPAITPRTKAILPVHLNGRIADMEPILAIAKKHGLFVITDAAQAIGSKYKGKPVGEWGDFVCLSFGYSKILETYGDGGMIFTNRSELAEKVWPLRTYGARSWAEIHTNNKVVGVASRLNSFQAAVLLEKLKYTEARIQKQRQHYLLYRELLKGAGDVKFLRDDADYYLNGYRLPVLTEQRGALRDFLLRKGKKVYNWYPVPLPRLPAFQNLEYKKGDFPNAERIAAECLILPTHFSIPKKKIAQIANLVRLFYQV
ncbi:MAG: hypothetical protein A3C11_00010 [Candidatus Sungbacteria bacterium RIFCSPHIGHO2_02_FULL_49_12]|uniref:Transcriptional regulator n=1 Tax=Candidatus Sungbacteria bacterium RIFCSPHIGHO2_02_FULL_49_12 TaxID=1802271 RepID=A0A1G2KTS2_9BACT|nr:MAG: hypothetical protein A3C11_00010 [Candidatus Sungbacteria bacterium RIFCSPHIGHO2_02_FULL_49_12]